MPVNINNNSTCFFLFQGDMKDKIPVKDLVDTEEASLVTFMALATFKETFTCEVVRMQIQLKQNGRRIQVCHYKTRREFKARRLLLLWLLLDHQKRADKGW